MEYRLLQASNEKLTQVVREFESDASVSGLLVFVAEGASLETDRLESVVRDSSLQAIGGIFPQVVYDGATIDSGVVLCGLPETPTVETVTGLDDPETDLRAQLDSEPLADGGRTAFVFVDAYTRVEEFVRTLFDTYGVEFDFVGGGTGELDDPATPPLLTPEGFRSDAAVVAILETESDIGVNHGWQEIDGPYRVTSADGRTVSALDGEPALEVYSRAVEDHAGRPVDTDAFFETAKQYPFALSRMGRESIVRDPYAVTDDGGLECFGAVPEGEFLHIMTGEADALVGAAESAYDDASGGDAAGSVLTFDCISRALFMGDSFSTELDAIGGPDDPAVGALTIGELANDGSAQLEYYNKTAVVAQLDGT